MSNIIKIKRGLETNISKFNLQQGELAITTDTNKLYVGTTSTPVQLNKVPDVKTSKTTSTSDVYSCNYIDTADEKKLDKTSVKGTKTTSDEATYSCTYANNAMQKHILGVTLSANVTPTTGAYIEISNWSQTLKIGDKLSISNGKIKIGSGVSYIKISGQLGGYNNENNLFYMFLRKNGNGIGTWQVLRSYGTYFIMPINQIVQVNEGDIISMATYSDVAYTLESGKTGVFFEVIS